MADIEVLAAKFRRGLLKSQQGKAVVLARAYAQVLAVVKGDLNAMNGRVTSARRTGETVDDSWVKGQREYTRLVRNLENELTKLIPVVTTQVASAASDAIKLAAVHAADASKLAGGAADIDATALRRIVGSVNNGPLEQLLQKYAGTASQQAGQIIVEGVARNHSATATARRLERVVGISRTKALTIVRTEQMRAYRGATREAFLADPNITRWVWSSRLVKGRTCSYCWAMHNTLHKTSEVMGTHPNCMCVMLPYVQTENYGETGEDRFKKLTDEEREEILGPKAAELYKTGKITLEDLVSKRRHPDWGVVGGPAPVDRALQNHVDRDRKPLKYA